MARAFQLGYVEFGTPRPEPELKYYSEVIGATETERGGDGTVYLSLGLDHHNVIVRPAEKAGVCAIGLQLTADVSLEDAAKQIRAHGIDVRLKSDPRAGMSKLLELTEPGGYLLELYTEMSKPAPGFGKRGVVPNKLGHIAIMTPEAPRTVKFFNEVLGFHITDRIDPGATFLTCNKDHHVLNVVEVPVRGLHHIAFELRDRAQHHDASDLLAACNIPIKWGPARHTAGHNLASYHFDPDGVLVELYADMDIYVPELGWFEPRPWHETLPMKPQVWQRGTLNTWGLKYDFDFRKQ